MKPVLLFMAAMLGCTLGFSQLNLVKDINPGYYEASHPAVVGEFSNGNVVLFASVRSELAYGNEPWISDGTAAGTKLLKDIHPGSNGSVFGLTAVMMNDVLYFIASDNLYGRELWRTDGTDTGTYCVKDIWPGPKTGIFHDGPIVVYNNKLYFTANDSVHGNELWCTDGTGAGTQLVVDITPGYKWSMPNSLIVGMGKLFFAANDSIHGLEYWSSDGTHAGTKMLADINPGTDNGAIGGSDRRFTWFNGTGYFSAIPSADIGGELFATDGDSVWMVKDIDPVIGKGTKPSLFTVANNKLYFKVNEHSLYGAELWTTDGTANGTVMVKDINSGNPGSLYDIHGELNGKLLFSAGTPTAGRELWFSDGTWAGTNMLMDLNPGAGTGKLDSRSETNQRGRFNECNIFHNGYFYFAGNKSGDVQLWVTDGSVAGTKEIKCTEPAPPLPGLHTTNIDWVAVADNKVWVSMKPGAEDYELYMYEIPTSISDLSKTEIHSELFPNPNNGIFNLKLNNTGFMNGQLQVVDIMGRQVYSQSIERGTRQLPVALPHAPAGMYNIIINLDNNIETHTISIER